MTTNLAADTGQLANYWPAWVAIAVATLVMLNQAITESEKFANLLGRFGRAIYARSKRKYRMDQIEFSDAVRQAVADERKRWEEDETRSLTVVNERMAYVVGVAEKQSDQIKELSFQLRCMTAYVEYEAEWHHRFRMAVLRADKGDGTVVVNDLPNHMHYAEFEKKCKDTGDMNWRIWANA